MSKQSSNAACQDCSISFTGDYCANCGRQRVLNRIDGKFIISEIGRVVNLDKGVFYTIRELLLRPGISIQQFIKEDRNRLVKPIVFLIVCSLVYSIFQKVLQFEDGYIGFTDEKESTTLLIFSWISENYGYANVLMAVFIAFWLKLFFRKYGYNFFEILILLCFMMGMGMLFFSVFGAIQSVTDVSILDKGFLIAILYMSWGIGQFFDKKKKVNYIKAFISYMLGMFTFSLIAIALGFLIDFVNK